MKNTISLPTAPAESPKGTMTPGAAATQSSSVTPSAEAPNEPKTRDRLMESLNPKARAILERKAKVEAKPSTATPPAPAAPAAAAASATPKPEAGAKPGDEGQGDEPPDAGVIDFTKLGEQPKADDDDAPPAELSDAELADVELVKKNYREAHKDNARLRKDRRAEREAKDKLADENKTLKQQLDEAQAARQVQGSRSYLDRFDKLEEVQSAREDALEALRQLQEDPQRESVTLPGSRTWKMLDAKGDHIGAQVSETAFDILEGFEAKVKQLGERGDAEKMVAEKLPVLVKLVPDFEKRYKALLESDWRASGPKLSLNAALGELVTSGDYVLQPRAKSTTKPAPKPAPKPTGELPATAPQARETGAETGAGEADVSALKKQALKSGAQKDIDAWIKASGKTRQRAA